MALFRHPHLTRGVVHTVFGSFRLERGVADLPEECGEALGWPRVIQGPPTATHPGAETARQVAQGAAASSDPFKDGLDDVLAGVKAVVRSHDTVELVARGIDVTFDGAVVARCRSCKVSWEIMPRYFKQPGWWSCPQGCTPRQHRLN